MAGENGSKGKGTFRLPFSLFSQSQPHSSTASHSLPSMNTFFLLSTPPITSKTCRVYMLREISPTQGWLQWTKMSTHSPLSFLPSPLLLNPEPRINYDQSSKTSSRAGLSRGEETCSSLSQPTSDYFPASYKPALCRQEYFSVEWRTFIHNHVG